MKIDSIHSPIQAAQMGELLTRCFPTPPGGRYWDDFPIWDPGVYDAATLSRWGVSEGGQLIACAGVRIAELNAGAGTTTRIALIGAVATSEQSRGRGLASELVSHAVEWAQARGAKLALLWGSEHSLYAKLGFELWGQQWMVPVLAQGPFESGAPASRIVIQRGWHPRIFDARMRRSTGLRLTEKDRAWYSAHRNVQWYSAEDSSYLAWGRGMDLGGVIHEWGGKPATLSTLLAAAVADGASSALGTPELLSELGIPIPPDLQPQALALVKVLDPSAAQTPLWIWGLDAV